LADYGGTLTWGLGFPYDWIDLVEAEPMPLPLHAFIDARVLLQSRYYSNNAFKNKMRSNPFN
jgi:hypothetical protein